MLSFPCGAVRGTVFSGGFLNRVLLLLCALTFFSFVVVPASAAATTTTTLAIAPPVPLGTSIFQGTPLAAVATVTDNNGKVGAGTVNFCYAGVTACTAANRLATGQVVSSGSGLGTVTVALRLPSGSSSLKAFYAGTATESASASSTVTVTVASHGGFPSATTISAMATGDTYTFSSTISATGSTVPTGSVSYEDQTNGNFKTEMAMVSNSSVKSYGYAQLGMSTAPVAVTGSPMVVADLNGDGFPDVAYATTAGGLEILLGDGKGGFTGGSNPSVSNVVAVASGDFDNDGTVDLATVGSDGILRILKGVGAGTFTQVASYTVVSSPTRIVVGDFNGDGFLDVAVSSQTSNAVEELLGSGTGTFTVNQTVSVPGASDMVTGDFNHDGVSDLAVASTAGHLFIFTGDTSGSLSLAQSIGGGSSGLLCLADFDGDGNLDLATADGAMVSVFAGSGVGTFAVAATTTLTEASTVTALQEYDFHGDGATDLYVTYGSSEDVYLGSSAGTFSLLGTYALESTPLAVRVADVDGDGLRDVLTLTPAGKLSVLQAQTSFVTTAMATMVTVPGSGTHQILARYGGDGTYAASSSGTTSVIAVPTPTVTVLTSSMVGRTAIGTPITLTATIAPASLGAEALTGVVTFFDNGTALAPTVSPSGGMATYHVAALGSGNHTYTAVYSMDTNFLESTSNGVTVYSALPAMVALSATPTSPVSTDVITLSAVVSSSGPTVNEGQVEFCLNVAPCSGVTLLGEAEVVSTTHTASVKIHLQPGRYMILAYYVGELNFTAGTSAAKTLTVNRVGLIGTTLGLSATSVSTSPLEQYSFTGTLQASSLLPASGPYMLIDTSNPVPTFSLGTIAAPAPKNSYSLVDATQTVPAGTGPDAVQVGDFNGDGYPDLAVANSVDATVSIFLNDGTGHYTVGSTIAVGGSPYAILAGDFNRDGHLDLAVANALGNSVTILLGDGTGHFMATAAPIMAGFTPTSIVAGDFNLDGELDLAIANYFSDSVTLLMGDGAGGFTAGATLALPAGGVPLGILAGDLNGDGVTDLLVPDNNGTVNVFLGSLAGMPANPSFSFPVSGAPVSAVLADMDGDGKLDLVYANFTGTSVAVMYGDGTGHFSAGTGLISVGAQPSALALADLNGDGLSDIVVTTTSPNQIVTLQNMGATFGAPVAVPLSGEASAIATGDFALDGLPAAVVLETPANVVDVVKTQYSMTAPGMLSPVTVYGGGTHQIEATYVSDGTFADATSTLVTVQGNLIPTTMSLTPSQTPAVGSSVLYSAQIAPSAMDNYTATGSTTFTVNGMTQCGGAVGISSGLAQCTPTTFEAGNYTVIATYSGDVNFAMSSKTVHLIVPKADPVITWANPADVVYGTALSSTQLNATANVAGTFAYTPAAGAVLSVGSHTLSMTFTPADTVNYKTVTATATLVVDQITPAITWTNPANIVYGTALSGTQLDATANVTGSFVYTPATGAVLNAGMQTLSVTFTPTDTTNYKPVTATVSLTVNKAVLTVTATSFTIVLGAPLPTLTDNITGFIPGQTIAVLGVGQPSLTLTPAAPSTPGMYPITSGVGTLAAANYSFMFVNGTLTITAGTSGLMLSAPSSVNLNASATLTAALTLSSTTPTPGGTITFLDGSTPVGSSPVTGAGSYSIQVALTPVGTHLITAKYSGDGSYGPITSNQQVVMVVAPSFNITVAPGALTLEPGKTGVATINLASVGGFAGAVQLGCSGLPSWASCTLMPSTLTVDGSGTTLSSKLVITTLGSSTGTVLAMLGIPGGVLGLLLLRGKKRRGSRAWPWLAMLLAGVAMASLTGCGDLDCCKVPDTGTGTYSVLVTAASSGYTMQTTTFTLKVQP